ncbi:MAG: hypothetical protein IJU44_00905 [Kiritimatiellae bacterium]|nr:hypothetical protein [Kiritimatiellia bacterium]
MLRRIKEALFLLALVWAAAAAAQNADDLRFSRANPCVLRVSSKGHVTGNPESKEMRRDGRQYAIYLVECVWNGKEEEKIQVEMIPMISGGKDTSPRYSITNSLAVSPGRTSSIRFFCPKNPPKNGYNPNVEKFRKVRGVVVRLLRNGRIFKIFCSSGAWQRNAWEPVFPGLYSPGKRLLGDDGADDNDASGEEPPIKKPELAEPKPVQDPKGEAKTVENNPAAPPATATPPETAVPQEPVVPPETEEPKVAAKPADKFDIPVPPDVAAKIRERAQKLYPDDFERQADEVTRQTKAWKRLQLEEDKLFLRDFM